MAVRHPLHSHPPHVPGALNSTARIKSASLTTSLPCLALPWPQCVLAGISKAFSFHRRRLSYGNDFRYSQRSPTLVLRQHEQPRRERACICSKPTHLSQRHSLVHGPTVKSPGYTQALPAYCSIPYELVKKFTYKTSIQPKPTSPGIVPRSKVLRPPWQPTTTTTPIPPLTLNPTTTTQITMMRPCRHYLHNRLSTTAPIHIYTHHLHNHIQELVADYTMIQTHSMMATLFH